MIQKKALKKSLETPTSMSFAEHVRFRKLNDELTDEEFFGAFTRHVGRDLIIIIVVA